MKASNKSSFIIGTILLVIAAFITISLIMQPFYFGINSSMHSNILFVIGNLLFSAYGFCSILIPLFLLIAGLSCFASIWTSQKTMRLITAVVPFFTAVATEKICRSILDLGNDSTNIVKIIIALTVGLCLIVVEIMGAGIVAEKINQKLFHSTSNHQKPTMRVNKSEQGFNAIKLDRINQVTQKNPKINTNMQLHDYDNLHPMNSFNEQMEKTSANPASILTQEEYALLTTNEDSEDKTEVEELEWPDLPPVPETLPPEYDEDYVSEEELDKNDPIFEFPPKEKTSQYSSRIDLADSEEKTQVQDEDFEEVTQIEKKPLVTQTKTQYSSRISLDDSEEITEDSEDDFEDKTEIQTKEDESFIDDDFLDMEDETSVKEQNQIFAQIAEQEEQDDILNKEEISEQEEIVIQKQKEEKPKVAAKKGPYTISTDLLTAYKDDQYWIIDEETKQASLNLKRTLSEFNIDADIIGIKKGPVVTMFELLPAPGVKLSKIVALADNIALALAAQSVRIVAPIPGKQAVGIEVPNKHRSIVGFREIIEMNLPEWNKMAVPVILGKDILGKAQIIDLTKTPHMLIAGATGSGKSVCVNTLILSILYKRSFRDVKMILVDPKVVELKLYNNIPHLLTPVITEPKKALQALQYCLCEMERRYALLDGLGVRDISSYNQRIKERNICTEKLPYIVVIIDEFADLMATSGKELESTVARLTAMSRAVGIHLVLATQRPSVNVITGLIKANIPSRIAFMVASRTDSNIIIDSVGAEKLLGRGDMLYASAVDPYPVRIQGTFVSDQEVEDVVDAVKEYGEPDYIDDEIFVEDDEPEGGVDLFGNAYSDEDPLYDQALEIVVQAGKASASYIQRRLKIGYNRAARLVEEMEERGIVGPANGSKPREIIHMP